MEPIVTRQEWERMTALMAARKSGRPPSPPPHMLSGHRRGVVPGRAGAVCRRDPARARSVRAMAVPFLVLGAVPVAVLLFVIHVGLRLAGQQ